jgi:Zn-dependent protease
MIFLLLGGIGLPGGAVYIETWRLHSKRWESAVSLAGPAANLVLAVILSIVLHFMPASGGGIWPGLAFLALLQVMAAVLNLIPVPPFDGYGIFAPFLDRDLHARINQASNLIMLVVFFVLWYVPFVSDILWKTVFWIAAKLQIPIQMAITGLSQFQFWRR